MSNLTNQEVIEILNKWGPEAIEKGLITEKEVYKAFFPNNAWDIQKWSVKKDTDSTVHQLEVGFKTHQRNYMRTMQELMWSRKETKALFDVEAMIYGDPQVKTLETRKTKIEALIKAIKDYNNHPKRKKWGLPLYTKLVFLKGLISEEDSHRAFEWNTQYNRFDEKI